MAGSNRFFLYTDDIGGQWAILRDEGSTEFVNGATAEAPVPTNSAILVGKGSIEPRYLNYNSPDGNYQRKVVFLSNDPADLAVAPVTLDIAVGVATVTLQLTSYIGERRRFVTVDDTKQLDGDSEQSSPSTGA